MGGEGGETEVGGGGGRQRGRAAGWWQPLVLCACCCAAPNPGPPPSLWVQMRFRGLVSTSNVLAGGPVVVEASDDLLWITEFRDLANGNTSADEQA